MSDGLLQDLFQGDVNTFPSGTDPAVAAKQAAALQKHLKETKQAEAEAKKQQNATAKKAVAAPKAAATPNPSKIRQLNDTKLHKIRMYFSNPGTAKKLSVKEPKPYPKTEEEIDALISAIEIDLASQGGIEQAGVAFISVVAGFEQFTASGYNPLNLQLSGPACSLTQVMLANKAKWDDLVTEFAIQNAEW